jgi:hypothetical protein
MSSSFLARPRLAPPPKVVAENVARRLGFEPASFPVLLRDPGWLLAHLGFGVGLALIHDLSPRPRSGIGFGVAAWVANYGVGLPLLGLYPRPNRDDRVRASASLAAHVVYGLALGRRASR